jgi:hypothetical protein
MVRRFPLSAIPAALALPVLFQLPVVAQTKPGVVVPAEPRQQARRIVDQLIRDGRIIRSSQVKRGMRGVAKSVFHGTKIENFNIEVLGVLSRVQGGGDIVLIKVLDGPVVKRQSGIVAGMSGSPVYINGKLLGAIALGWGFPKEPIGGVTPITEMIETSLPDPQNKQIVSPSGKTRPASSAPVKTSQSTWIPKTPLRLAGHNITKMVVSRDSKRVALVGNIDSATMTMKPASTLLQLSGFSQSSLPRLRKMFDQYQIEPVIGPASKKTGVKPPFIPGGAIGVQLVSGDMDQTAIGTITFRWGNRILAFGHPMFGQGAASLPMATAFVHEIFPSYQRSFKLASPVDVIGALQQDTQFAIGGTIGMTADTIPMTVSLRDKSREIAKTYRVRVMKDPSLTPQLIGSVAQEAIETTLGLTSDKMVRVGLAMKIEGTQPIVRRNLLYSSQPVTAAALADLGQTLALTQMNEFARGSIQRVDLTVDVEPVRKTARLKSMTADRNRLKAGESVNINVVLEPTDTPNQTVTHTFAFKVPDNAPSGVMRIAASVAANYWPLQMRVGGAPPEPVNLKQLVNAWDKVGSLDELLVVASTPRQYLQVEQQRVNEPPPAFARLMKTTQASNVAAYNEVEMRRDRTDFSLTGAQFLNIPVESKRHPDKGSTATATPAPATSSGPTVEITVAGTTPEDGNSPQSTLLPLEESANPYAMFLTPLRQAAYSGASQSDMIDRLLSTSPFLEWLKMSQGTTLQAPRVLPNRSKPDRPTTPSVNSPTPTASPSPSPTVTPSPTPSPTPTADSKDLARPAQSWVQSSAADFLNGDFDRTQINSDGQLRLSPPSQRVLTTADPFVWSIAGDANGNVFTGLSNPARVWRVGKDGRKTTIFESDAVAIPALTTDAAGNVYAGITPGGDVVRISPSGERTTILNTNGSFVGAMEWDERGRLLAGIGGENAQLFRIDNPATRNAATGTLSPLATVPQHHIRAIAVRGNDIYLGSGDEGVLYRVDAGSGATSALFQAGDGNIKTSIEGEILAVAAAPEGIYFGTSASGTLYRWTAEDGVTALYPSPQQAIYALRRAGNGTLYMATGEKGIVYQIQPGSNPNNTYGARILEPTPLQALSLALTPDNQLLVGTGNNGSAFRVALDDTKNGQFVSTVFDAKNVVQWGAVRMIGQNATIETRSGNTLSPDASWSNWHLANSNNGEMQVASPAARYLQYRVRLTGGENSSANLARLEVLYRAKNTAPTLTLSAPRGGEFWNGKKKLAWSGKDTDNDTLRYRAWISGDEGKTWQTLALSNATSDSLEIDTSKHRDGVYRIRIEASDAARNPDDPQKDTQTSLPFIIDNTPPRIMAQAVSGTGDARRLQATVSDDGSPVAGAVWRWEKPATPAAPTASPTPTPTASTTTTAATPAVTATTIPEIVATAESTTTTKTEADWQAAAATDGIFDSRRESIVAQLEEDATDAKAPKPTQIELRAQDAAGNSSTVKIAAP